MPTGSLTEPDTNSRHPDSTVHTKEHQMEASSKPNRKPPENDAEALDQIAGFLGMYRTDPGANPIEELISDIEANVQATGRRTDIGEGA